MTPTHPTFTITSIVTINSEISATAVPCTQCGYDLRATPATGRCPECGKPVAPAHPCMLCQYDLRATPATGRCPECGLTVAATLAQQRGELFEPKRVGALAGGFLGLAIALPTLALAHLIAAWLPQHGPNLFATPIFYVFALVTLVAGVGMLVGNTFLAHPLMAHDPDAARHSRLLILFLFPVVVLFFNIIPFSLRSYLGLDLDWSSTIGNQHGSVHALFFFAFLTSTVYLLLVSWRLRDLAHTAPALQRTYLQGSVTRIAMIILALFLNDWLLFTLYSNPNYRPGYIFLLYCRAADLLLLGILAYFQFRRTQIFYRHCKIQWAASLPPKSEIHP